MNIVCGLLTTMITMESGVFWYGNHKETYYNLNMNRVVQTAQDRGINLDYWERADGVKMFGKFAIVAADYKLHPYGSTVETSRGTGIVLDTGEFTKNASVDTIDIAVTW